MNTLLSTSFSLYSMSSACLIFDPACLSYTFLIFFIFFTSAGTVRRADIVVAAVGRAEMVKKVRTILLHVPLN